MHELWQRISGREESEGRPGNRLPEQRVRLRTTSATTRATTRRSGDNRLISEIMPRVITSTPPGSPTPIGPYSHIAKVGTFITIGGMAGVDPKTGQLAGTQIAQQTRQVLDNLCGLLESAGSDLDHIVHMNIFLLHKSDFEEMNRAYAERMGTHRPARTVIGVSEFPKPGILLTMNLTAVTRD